VLATLVTLSALVLFSEGPAVANHPTGACLDLAPETDTNPVGTVHFVTATMRTRGTPSQTNTNLCDDNETPVNAGGSVTISFEITGPNDPDDPDSSSPETPDRSCQINTDESSCTIGYLGNITGTDTIRGWIDHDARTPGQGGVTEADMAEGQSELLGPGTGCTGLGPTESAPEPEIPK
jgi:hypothetical protein